MKEIVESRVTGLSLCSDTMQFCCGVSEVGNFECVQTLRDDLVQDYEYATMYHSERIAAVKKELENYDNGKAEEEFDEFEQSGTGFFVSTFVDNEHCRAAYDYLTKEHTLLFQSKPRLNGNRIYANKVFICVFLHKDAKKERK